MAEEEKSRYEVVITSTAEIHFYELVEYLYEHMAPTRAEEVATLLSEAAFSLDHLYHRGNREENLVGRKNDYRYILFNRTARATVKIIYYADEQTKTVFVTDFFPTEKDPKKLGKRSE